MLEANTVNEYVDDFFIGLGQNKRQEVARLLYEIARKEKVGLSEIVSQAPTEERNYTELKRYLLKRRFPQYTDIEDNLKHFIPKLDINPSLRVPIKDSVDLVPKHFIIEESVRETPMVQRLLKKFPQARFEYITRYKEYKGKKRFTIGDYNQRLQKYFIIKEEYDFYKRCACSVKSVYCGYHVVNLGSGCAFECAYCYLQDYINSPGIVLPANIEDFFEQFDQYKQDIRMGSGEITDSLVFDHITEFSPRIVEFFKKHPGSTFEFKTKSDNIDNLLTVTPGNNIVVSWSMNPPEIVDAVENYTASLDRRLEAALKCQKAGYKLAFHFDPVIHYPGWEKGYEQLVNRIYDTIDPARLAWLSMGTLRMTPRLKKIIENRFPDEDFLVEEFLPGYDKKLRYPLELRNQMYTKMKEWIRNRDREVYLYLCMEEKDACEASQSAPLKQYQTQ